MNKTLKRLKAKKGSVSIETVLLLVLVTLALVASLVALGKSMSTTIDNASTSISNETACGLKHGYYDAVGGKCYTDSKMQTEIPLAKNE